MSTISINLPARSHFNSTIMIFQNGNCYSVEQQHRAPKRQTHFLLAYLPFFHSASVSCPRLVSISFCSGTFDKTGHVCARAMLKPLEACVVELAAPESACLHPNGNGANDQALLLNCERLVVCLCVYGRSVSSMTWQLQIPSSVRWKFTHFDSMSHTTTHNLFACCFSTHFKWAAVLGRL